MSDNTEAVDVVEEVEEVVEKTPEAKPEVVEEVAQAPKEEETEAQRKINRAVRLQFKAEAQAEQLRERLERIEQRQQEQVRTAVVEQTEAEPKLEDFPDYENFLKASAKYEARQEFRHELAQHSQRINQQQAQAAQRQTVESWNQKVSSVTAEMPDFDEVVGSSTVPMPDHVKAVVMQSEEGPKLAYYLATHPDEAVKIASQHPLAAIRSLMRIEDEITAAPVVKKATDAAAPITPVGTKAKSEKAPEDMTFDEFTRYRKKIISQRR